MLRFFQQLLWMISERAILHGYPVAYGSLDETRTPVAQAQLLAAFDLLAESRPRWLQRMRSYVRRIQVRDVIDSLGKWHRVSRLVELDSAFVCNPATSVAEVASTLVHEFTHARIDGAGVRYSRDRRIRVERACLAQEFGFAMSLPEGDERAALIARLERQWAEAESIWSDAADEQRAYRAAAQIGMPRWLVSSAWRYRKWRERDRRAA